MADKEQRTRDEERQPLLQTDRSEDLQKVAEPVEPALERKLSVMETAFALMAGTVGGEIVAIPYSCQHLGLYLGVATLLAAAAFSHISNMMHLKVKDLSPYRHESLYELAYLLCGRWAIYTVCLVQYLLNSGTMLLYYVIIGQTAARFYAGLTVNHTASKTFTESKDDLRNEPLGI